MSYDIVVKNGLIVSSNGSYHADLAISGETIRAIGQNLQGKDEIDATDCYVIPGGVDPHVHMNLIMNGQMTADNFATGTVAAACGGTTTVIDFVTPEPEEPMLDALAKRRAEADEYVAIDYGLHMTIPTWHGENPAQLADVPVVMAAGCYTFKAYQAYSGFQLDDEALFHVLRAVGNANGKLVLHSEAGPLLDVLIADAVAAGHTGAIWHDLTRPPQLEASAINRAAEMADLANCPLHIFHVGCAAAVEAIDTARRQGIDIQGETCPQYLLLTAEEHLDSGDGNLYLCSPPLRSQEDQDAMWQAIAGGCLQIVSTDHCPWLREQKAADSFAKVPGGVPGIETRMGLLYHFGVRTGKLTLERWVEVCCTNPAQWMGLTQKGRLVPGYDADVVIFDPNQERQIISDSLHEAIDYSIYEGWTVRGWARTVLQRGRVIVERGEFVGKGGHGRFVKRG